MSWLVIEYSAIDSVELANLAMERDVTQHASGPTLHSALAGIAIPFDDAFACVKRLIPSCEQQKINWLKTEGISRIQRSLITDEDRQEVVKETTTVYEHPAVQLDGQFVGPTSEKQEGESSEAVGGTGATDEDDSPLEPTELEEAAPVTTETA